MIGMAACPDHGIDTAQATHQPEGDGRELLPSSAKFDQ